MAKYYNNRIKTGRVGGSVFAVRKGVVIERAYNPIVNNPSTDGQVSARAKFKLVSQVAAALGDDLLGYIGGKGLQSERNLFTKKVFDDGAVSFSNGAASLDISNVQLTGSSLVFGNVGNVAAVGSTVTVSIVADPLFTVQGSMVYGVVVRPSVVGGLVVIGRGTAEVSTRNVQLPITTTLAAAAGDRVIVFMMRPAGSGAIAAYNNIIGDGTSVVSVSAIRNLIKSGYEVSRSRNILVTVSSSGTGVPSSIGTGVPYSIKSEKPTAVDRKK